MQPVDAPYGEDAMDSDADSNSDDDVESLPRNRALLSELYSLPEHDRRFVFCVTYSQALETHITAGIAYLEQLKDSLSRGTCCMDLHGLMAHVGPSS